MSLTTPDKIQLMPIISLALQEDIGQGDATSELLMPQEAMAVMQLNAREPMVVCGLFIARLVFEQLDPKVKVDIHVSEGARVTRGTTLLELQGHARCLLTAERVILNLMQRMCGVATLTAEYVKAVEGTGVVILDTRKTMPCLRVLDKYSVRAGGGQNHRMRLDDMVMIKDNHIALYGGIAPAVMEVRSHSKLPVIVECDTLQQVEEAVKAKPDRILLDNMDNETLKKAVSIAAGNVPLEASGGVSLETVRAIAQTGVGYISVGRLTHSATAVDIGADITLEA